MPGEFTEQDLVALGGDLLPQSLLTAYRQGIFPFYSAGQPIQWWSPDPRFVLFPNEVRVSHSMRTLLRRQRFRVTVDTDFESVILNCRNVKRTGQIGTWITRDMLKAYIRMHQLGVGHSVEVWDGQALVGGLYGLALGQVFFGESMFCFVSNASKYGFLILVRWLWSRGFALVDCQQSTRHLGSLGARSISRLEFLDLLKRHIPNDLTHGSWTLGFEEWLEQEGQGLRPY